MRCEDAHKALPILNDDDAAAVRVHASACAECALLLEAFEADAQALEAMRGEPRDLPPVMSGFADAVMAAIAEEPVAATPAPEGKVLRPAFGGMSGLIAMAAMTLLAIGMGIVLSSGEPQDQGPTAQISPPAPAPVTPVVAQDVEPLPAPRRTENAPMPRRSRRGIGVPVDGGRTTPQLPSGPLFDVLRDVQRAFPRGFNQRSPQRIPPLRPGEREVRF